MEERYYYDRDTGFHSERLSDVDAKAHPVPDIKSVTYEDLEYAPVVIVRFPYSDYKSFEMVERGDEVRLHISTLKRIIAEQEEVVGELVRAAYLEGFAVGTGNTATSEGML